MPQKRRDFLYNISSLVAIGGLSKRLGEVSLFGNSNAIHSDLSGTKLENIKTTDMDSHSIEKEDSIYNITIDWRMDNAFHMEHTFSFTEDELEKTPGNIVRDPMRVIDNSSEKQIVTQMATGLEEAFLSNEWQEESKETIKEDFISKENMDSVDCREAKGHLICEVDAEESVLSRGDIIISKNIGNEDELELVPEIIRFVQSLEYELDYERGNLIDYAQYPIETIYMGVGDCEDSAILLATFLENLESVDIRTGLTFPPGHCATIAAIPDLPNSEKYDEYITIDGVPYTYFETTKVVDMFGSPSVFEDEPPLFVYHDSEIKKVNGEPIPSSTRRLLQTLRETIES